MEINPRKHYRLHPIVDMRSNVSGLDLNIWPISVPNRPQICDLILVDIQQVVRFVVIEQDVEDTYDQPQADPGDQVVFQGLFIEHDSLRGRKQTAVYKNFRIKKKG